MNGGQPRAGVIKYIAVQGMFISLQLIEQVQDISSGKYVLINKYLSIENLLKNLPKAC